MDEEGEQLEGEEGEEGAAKPVPTTTTTTEAPKKIRPSIRPFRSNDDLLSALKKRRLESKNSKPGKQPIIGSNSKYRYIFNPSTSIK